MKRNQAAELRKEAAKELYFRTVAGKVIAGRALKGEAVAILKKFLGLRRYWEDRCLNCGHFNDSWQREDGRTTCKSCKEPLVVAL